MKVYRTSAWSETPIRSCCRATTPMVAIALSICWSRRVEAQVRIVTTSRNRLRFSKAKSKLPSAVRSRSCDPVKHVNIPANAPHYFTNASKQTARLLCICAPAGQEEFFAQVGVVVATRTTPPPKLDKAGQAEFMKKAQELAPKYRTELLKP